VTRVRWNRINGRKQLIDKIKMMVPVAPPHAVVLRGMKFSRRQGIYLDLLNLPISEPEKIPHHTTASPIPGQSPAHRVPDGNTHISGFGAKATTKYSPSH
jgi:hypothetical protein